MKWNGKTLYTVGEIGEVVQSCKTPEEAQEFMRQYREDSPHADENIGYLSGYYDRAEMIRVQDWFGVTHPVFGKAQLTPDQLLAAGRAAASGADRADIRTMVDPA